MTFSEAVHQLKFGHRMTRKVWKDEEICIKLYLPLGASKRTESEIYLIHIRHNAQTQPLKNLYVGTYADFTATDWEPVNN